MMNNTRTTNSNVTNKKDSELNVLDLLLYLLYHWKWFVLSLIICGGLAYLKYAKTSCTYYSSLKVLFKDPTNGNAGGIHASTVGLDKYSSSINSVNVANEMQMLLSKDLLREMVYRTHADIRYLTKDRFRVIDHYGDSPISVSFIDSVRVESAALTIKLKDINHAELSDANGLESKKTLVALNQTVNTKAGRIIIMPAMHIPLSWIGVPIRVIKTPVEDVVRYYHTGIGIDQKKKRPLS
jgi:tyrosine-protein kinase Etk/Wzc